MSCCKPTQDGTCQNGHAVKPEKSTAAGRLLWAVADEIATRARHERMRVATSHRGEALESLAGFLMRAAMYTDEFDVHLDDLNPTSGGPDVKYTRRETEARWLETQAQLYDGQEGVKERELASLIRSMSFLCQARGASLEQLRVMVEREGAGR